MYCEKCGKEIKEGEIICSNCGKAVPENQLDKTARDRIEKEKYSDNSLKKNRVAGIRVLGIVLMIISGICDIVSMILIGTGDFDVFNGLTIGSTITFFIGLALTFAFR